MIHENINPVSYSTEVESWLLEVVQYNKHLDTEKNLACQAHQLAGKNYLSLVYC